MTSWLLLGYIVIGGLLVLVIRCQRTTIQGKLIMYKLSIILWTNSARPGFIVR
uniref:Uncharacterized protein n=1 Tax=Caudovirales sp. ctGAB12 TaxID=2827632 RepID=A0A8S5SPS8_9CAUD|nr:MAG TPA: hypothetical protein [Caudovirales sp. ctGAB12]DAN40202.1 MAG TPA: hypothetical protein [Caudoviricetes sp.]DAW43043.1 MAG TPA: hypothetical protein [Bacteriophage sp.]DAN45614.1 MAG TPA: hypothetical protein [Caudoviricetes sp.]DAN89685.1 MAG TPA: hypothetical protein [Caudoviricetes sp.]